MKTFRNVLRAIGVLAAVLVGGIPLMIGVVCGLLLRPVWMTHATGLLIASGITVLSWSNPEWFRFGALNLNLHGSITIGGEPLLLLNLGYNLGLVLLGVLAGLAARNAYDHART
ncbi:hypothetical protein OVA24_16855 [Luteolibacter sp. SL250]|uniref:hypothetical protein n=1 Tax=Luteolibacter sp. SL250 TaxID=2995170 RepID=UPI00226FEB97|nr:hypothetical protein [Luteolibacter sp. SL250]WAC18903.1 hypothetical protein OVA24_16855 [Luteolibacter sp. SL250]